MDGGLSDENRADRDVMWVVTGNENWLQVGEKTHIMTTIN